MAGGKKKQVDQAVRARCVADYFMRVVDLPLEERDAYLRQACPNAEIRTEVQVLLGILPMAIAHFGSRLQLCPEDSLDSS